MLCLVVAVVAPPTLPPPRLLPLVLPSRQSGLKYFCEIPICAKTTTTGAAATAGPAKTTTTTALINPCLEDGVVDDDCCAVPSSAGCAPGYTYSYSEKDRCLRSDSWRAFTTICTPCTDALDQPGAKKPWYDFVSCAEEAPFCDSNDVVRQGCAKTCKTCGSSDGSDALRTTTTTTTTTQAPAARLIGGARLSYEGCVGCKEFYASAAATSAGALDWESCLGAGITIRMSADAISVSFNDELCGAAMSPGPKTYGQLGTHAVGFRVQDDDAGALPVYVLATANAGTFVLGWRW